MHVRPSHPKNINHLAHAVSQAFFDDPLFQYFFPDEATRLQLSFYTFKFIIAHALQKGFVSETSAALEGIFVVLPSDHIHRGVMDQIRFGALQMLLRQGGAALNRQKTASEYMKSLHAHYLSRPHLYWSTIAVAAGSRGQGFASALMRPMLAKADAAERPCYLDTHNEDNVRLYQHFGFRVVHDSMIPHSPVRHWAMIRDGR